MPEPGTDMFSLSNRCDASAILGGSNPKSCPVGSDVRHFALQAPIFDLRVMLGFDLIGLMFRAANYPLAPVVIGTIWLTIRRRRRSSVD
jgi:hypothetical protein